MLNTRQHLIVCLAEEAGEIVQACGKVLRFGLNDGYPGTGRTNVKDLVTEIAHVKAIAGMLGLTTDKPESELIQEKIEKVREHMQYARKKGELSDEDK